MKSIVVFTFSLLLVTSCFQSDKKDGFFWNNTKKVTGNPVDKEFAGDFDEIKVAQSIEAELIKSDQEKVIINAPSGIIDDVLVENNGGKLNIHFKNNLNFTGSHRVKAKIYVKDFSSLKANSAAKIFTKDQFTQEKTLIDASSSGQIEGYYEANDLRIETSSAGSFKGKIWAVDLNVQSSSSGIINAEGKVKSATISSSSAGGFHGEKVFAQMVDLDASSAGEIKISAEKQVKADASSGASIQVKLNGNQLAVSEVEENSGGSVTIN